MIGRMPDEREATALRMGRQILLSRGLQPYPAFDPAPRLQPSYTKKSTSQQRLVSARLVGIGSHCESRRLGCERRVSLTSLER